MYIGLLDICLEWDQPTKNDRKEIASLVQKIRSRFKLTVNSEYEDEEWVNIYVAFLHPKEATIKNLADEVCDLCERVGIGRIAEVDLSIESLVSDDEDDDFDD